MLHHNPHRVSSGFTLIEFLLYMALAVTMVAIIGTIGISILKSNMKAVAQEEVMYEAGFALEKIRRAIDDGERIDSPMHGASATALSIATRNPLHNPTIIELEDGKIYMQKGAGVREVIAGENTVVSALTFTNVSYPGMNTAIRLTVSVDAQPTDNLSRDRIGSTYYTTMQVPYAL